MKRAYEGDALDGTFQYITESPVWGDNGETVDATDRDDPGRITSENVPGSEDDRRQPTPEGLEGQTSLSDWELDPVIDGREE